MSMRQGWTYNGQHFSHTSTERGGNRYFIDGKPTRYELWRAALNKAKFAEREAPDRDPPMFASDHAKAWKQ